MPGRGRTNALGRHQELTRGHPRPSRPRTSSEGHQGSRRRHRPRPQAPELTFFLPQLLPTPAQNTAFFYFWRETEANPAVRRPRRWGGWAKTRADQCRAAKSSPFPRPNSLHATAKASTLTQSDPIFAPDRCSRVVGHEHQASKLPYSPCDRAGEQLRGLNSSNLRGGGGAISRFPSSDRPTTS